MQISASPTHTAPLRQSIEASPAKHSPATSRRTVYDHEYIRSLFDRISARYDLLNHLLSAGFDIRWRKMATAILKTFQPKRILDVATGTGDLAIELASIEPESIIGLDIAPQMLERGREKVREKRLEQRIAFEEGTAEEMRFPTGTFDAVTVAFGVRNFSDLSRGLSEMHRVLKRGGVVLILEFSKPQKPVIKQLYTFYFERILPVVGGTISGSPDAYRYLPATVKEFPMGEEFLSLLRAVGFSSVQQYPLTFDIATIYVGIKQ